MFRKYFLWIVVVIAAIGLLWFADVSRETRIKIVDPSGSPIPTPSPSVTNKGPNIVNKYPPAECALSGKINYRAEGIYENLGAQIDYKYIDSVARHIIWTTSPQDDLSVGPNLFANLPVPNGTEDVTVGLPQKPKAKNYILTANVSYGVFVNGNLEIKESRCSGQIPVSVNY